MTEHKRPYSSEWTAADEAKWQRDRRRRFGPPASPEEERQQTLAAMGAALLAHLRGREPDGAAAVYAGCGLRAIRTLCLAAGGRSLRHARMAAGSDDFSVLLTNVVEKRVADFYVAQAPVVRTLTRRVDLGSFRPGRTVRLDLSPMPIAGEHKAIAERAVQDSGEAILLLRLALIASLSYEAIVNDDLAAFDGVAELLGASAAAGENALFMSALLANADTADGEALFSAAHANLAGTPGALDATTLAASMALLRAQTSPAGTPLNLRPHAVLVGPAQERAALALVRQATIPGDRPMRVLVDAAIPDNRHYTFSDPQIRPAFFRGRLRGRPETPAVAQDQTYESDARRFRGTTHFCVGVGDWRGAVLTAAS